MVTPEQSLRTAWSYVEEVEGKFPEFSDFARTRSDAANQSTGFVDAFRGQYAVGKERGKLLGDISLAEKEISVALNLAKLKKGLVTVTVGGVAEDTIKGFENAAGGTGNDSLSGDKRANMLIGNAGGDFLYGDKGADILFGGLGKDTLKGGAGGDQFLFFEPVTKGNLDTLSDFKHGEDKFVLDHTIIFAAIGATLEAGEFVSRSFTKALKAKQADDHLLYNTKTGQLSYDADGKGGAAAIHFATFTDKPQHLDITDFLIV